MVELFYLVGYVLSYILWRFRDKYKYREYTVGRRKDNLIRSLFSWLSVLVVISEIFGDIINGFGSNDEKAKW